MSDDKKNSDKNDGLEIDSINGDSIDSPASSDEVANLRKELTAAKNSYLYLRADFENYKSQAIKERAELAKFGAERLVVALLDALDTFDRALQMEITQDNYTQFKEGMGMTAKELLSALARFGVKEQDPLGQPFNPSVHEALSSEETTEFPAGHICRVFKKAYSMHDRVIRPAQVVVAKAPAGNAQG